MKILWLSHFIPYPPKGGVLQRGYHLLKQTAKHHDVHLLAFNQKDLIRPLFNSLEEGIQEADVELNKFCKSIKFVPLPCDDSAFKKYFMALKSLVTPTPYTMNWLISDEYRQQLRKILKETDFDYIHFDTISLAPFKDECGDTLTSLDHHNIESHMLLRRASKESNWIKKLYYYQEGIRLEKFEKKHCPEFGFNFTCSDIDTERLQGISPSSKVHTIANGVDTEYFVPNNTNITENKLIFVGTLSWYPNIEAVLFIMENIWPLVKNKFPDASIDIIGANPPEQIVEYAKEDRNFRVHGFVDDIIPYLNEAKCYVCPIKDGGGTKLKIVDALSIGKAIIADEIACEGIDVVDNKDVIFASSGEEYLAAISKVFTDNNLREELQKSARKVAQETYSYDMIGKQLSNLFISYSKK